MEHPPPVGVVKLVGLPLVLEQIEPLGMKEQWFSSPKVLKLNKKRNESLILSASFCMKIIPFFDRSLIANSKTLKKF